MGLTVTGFTVLWSVLLILFIIAEAITVQLVSIWFAIRLSCRAYCQFLRCEYTCAGGTFCRCIVCGSFADKTAQVKKFSTPKIQRTNIARPYHRRKSDSHGGDRQSSCHRHRKSRRKIVECSFRRRKHYTGGKRRRGAKNRRC